MTDRGSGSPKQRATAQRGTKLPKQARDRPRRVSRREREAKRQKQIRWGIGLAAVAVIAILIGFSTYDYVIKPRQVLATVDGTRIRRDDYWRFRSLELYNQVAQYSQFAQFVNDPSQQQQYQSLALQAQNELGDVWGSTAVNDTTLQQMINNQIYLSSLDEFGLSISDDEAKLWAQNQFAPADSPLIPPTVTPTFVPERAAWATGTAQAMAPPPSPTAAAATPEGSPAASPMVEGSPAASPNIAASPSVAILAASPMATPIASPAGGSPEASPPAPTMEPAQAQQTAEAGFDSYSDAVLSEVHMSEGDYLRLYARPQLAQQKIRDVLTADIGQTADQLHAEHILVATEELANQIYADVTTGGQNFETVAMEKSTDTSTAPNGGDLGWFSQGVMVEPFEQAAFSTAPGEIHAPIQSDFGWHIIKVIEAQPGRALTDEQISHVQDSTVNRWLEGQQQVFDISSVMAPTPTPATETFVPPVDAPAPPIATESSLDATPGASPVASPVGEGTAASDQATPLASPVVETLASPVATPMVEAPVSLDASPVTVVQATPQASPAASDTTASPAASPVVEAVTPLAPSTPVAVASSEATPAGSPSASPVASSVSSPIMNPLGTPSGS